MSTPWAGYTRVSRVGDRGERLISPELQLGRIDGHARSRGLDVVHLEPELDQSGGKRERPVLRMAIDGVRDGRYAGLIVAQLDRLSRLDLADALKVIAEVEDAGGQVIAVAENVDPGTPEGRMARNMFLSLADMQLGRYKAQFASAKQRAVEHGIWPSPVAPTGYTVKARKHGGDGRLHVDTKRAPLVRRAFELRATGESWTTIARLLGVGSTGAHKIIANRVYLGELRLVVRGEQLVNPASHEPLVSRDLFEAAQLSHPRPPRNGAGHASLLTGLVRCAGCRQLMQTDREHRNGNEWWYYRCTYKQLAGGKCTQPALIAHRLVHPYVEELVLAHLEGIAFTASDRTVALDRAGRELDAAEAELAAFQDAQRVSGLGAEHFVSGMRSRVADVEDRRRALAEARLARGPLPDAGELQGLWPKLSVEERRHVLRGSLSAVYVKKGRGLDGRVRVVAAGSSLVLPAIAEKLVPLDWTDADLPGEIRPALAQDVG